MKLFDNNAICDRRKERYPAQEPEKVIERTGASAYPLIIDYGALIVGKTLRPEPGQFKFRSKLLKCTFNKDDIWAFVIRSESRLIICRVTCGPYKEFAIIDEFEFPDIERYVTTQSKALRFESHMEVGNREDALKLVAGGMKLKPGEVVHEVMPSLFRNYGEMFESMRVIYRQAVKSGVEERKVVEALELMYGDALRMPLPGFTDSFVDIYRNTRERPEGSGYGSELADLINDVVMGAYRFIPGVCDR